MAAEPRLDRSFERLYRRHAPHVYRYAYGMLRNRADAEDVTQTTFLNAYKALERGDDPRAPLNWLIKIAHNVCLQRFRTAARRPQEIELDYDVADEIAAADDGPAAEDIRRALGHLAFNQRAAIVLREIEGRSYAEIAEVLGLSASAVETLVFRARRSLREQLEGSITCAEAELHVSKQLDKTISRAERSRASSPPAGVPGVRDHRPAPARPAGGAPGARRRRSVGIRARNEDGGRRRGRGRARGRDVRPAAHDSPAARKFREIRRRRPASFRRDRHLIHQDVPSSPSSGAMPPAGPGGCFSLRMG